jgi:Rrf2 family protein
LAEFHGIPAPYLTKHLQGLVRAGLVGSVPGPRGGFRLARRPDDITLLDVVEAIDGTEPAFRCTEIRRRGPMGAGPDAFLHQCGVASAFAAAEQAWRDSLATTTISALLGSWQDSVEVEVWVRSGAWIDDPDG